MCGGRGGAALQIRAHLPLPGGQGSIQCTDLARSRSRRWNHCWYVRRRSDPWVDEYRRDRTRHWIDAPGVRCSPVDEVPSLTSVRLSYQCCDVAAHIRIIGMLFGAKLQELTPSPPAALCGGMKRGEKDRKRPSTRRRGRAAIRERRSTIARRIWLG